MEDQPKPSLELIVYMLGQMRKALDDALIEFRTSRKDHEDRLTKLETWRTSLEAKNQPTSVTVNNNGADWPKIVLALIALISAALAIIYGVVVK